MKKTNILIKVTDKMGKEYSKKIECNVLDTFNTKNSYHSAVVADPARVWAGFSDMGMRHMGTSCV